MELRRIKLTVAYDGTAYCGYQIQPNGNTVEAELKNALVQLLKHPVKLIGASRTDAGVHAKGNVAVFDTTVRMPASRMAFALNTYLPGDIRIQNSVQVPSDFHPRYCNTRKTYEYKILNRQIPDPCMRLYSFFYYRHLDECAMQQAGDFLVGTHDFSSFCTHKPEITDYVRTIESLKVIREGDLITIRITGNGFLYNMVRIIAGTLLRVGTGDLNASEISAILEKKDRFAAGETARPEGLTLVSIEYPDGDDIIKQTDKGA